MTGRRRAGGGGATGRPVTTYITSVMYVLYGVAGAAAFVFPSRAVTSTLPLWALPVWAVFFVVGGLVCLLGILCPRYWYGKLVGLPLLLGSVATYGGACILQFISTKDGSYLFLGLLLLSSSASLTERMVNTSKRFTAMQKSSQSADEVSARRRR